MRLDDFRPLHLQSVLYMSVLYLIMSFLPAFAVNLQSVEDLPITQFPIADARLNELLKEGDAFRSESILNAIVEREPSNWRALVNLAYLHEKKWQYPTAKVLLMRAKAIVPQEPTVLGELGYLYLKWASQPDLKPAPPADALAQAERLLKQALAMRPNDAMLPLYYAELCFFKDKNSTEAKRYVKQALAMHPTHQPALLLASHLYQEMGLRSQAQQALLMAYDLGSENPAVLDAMSRMLAKLERPEDAIHYANEATLYDVAESPERLRLKAQQYEKLADPQKALQNYQALAPYFPKSPELSLKKASLTEQVSGTEKATPAFQEAMRLNLDLVPNYKAEAKALIIKESLDAAKAPLQSVLKLTPEDPQLLSWLSILYYRNLLLGQTVDKAELASVQRLLKRSQSTTLKMSLPQGTNALSIQPLSEQRTLEALRLKLVAQDGVLDAEDLKQLSHLKSFGATSVIRAESAFLYGDMSTVFVELKRMPSPATAEDALDLGHQWRLMQFVPGALKAFQWAYTANPTDETRRRIVELEQVDVRIEERLHALQAALPQGVKSIKKIKQAAMQQQLNQLKTEANIALQLNPCHPLPWELLADVAEREGQWGRAVLLWQEAKMRDSEGKDQARVHQRLVHAKYQASKAGVPPLTSLMQRGHQAVPASVGYTF
ncbi:MAG: tetratricopeptide repeat protein [Vampirovibrionales bacterium]